MYGGDKIDTDVFKKAMAGDALLTGITLSGGEPFLQPVAALELARFAHSRNLNVWCYTGYTFEQIMEWEDNRKTLLKEIDVLVDGPFEKDKMSLDIPWRGSGNQRLIDVKKSLEKGEVVLYDGADTQGSQI
jgi:anaerobic ribonucleoside-triphosphate reductase activating protein